MKRAVVLALAIASGSAFAQASDVIEMATHSLYVRGTKAEFGPDKIERLNYTIRNTTTAPVRVMLMVDSLGMCSDFGPSSLKIGTLQDAVESGGRDGYLVRPGEEVHQSISGGRDCIRPNDILNFVGFFLVRSEGGRVRAERFALGNFYVK